MTERAISNELDRIASKSVISDAKLEKRVEVPEKRAKELEEQLLEKHNEIMMLKRQVDKLNQLADSKAKIIEDSRFKYQIFHSPIGYL